MKIWSWDPAKTPAELIAPLRSLGELFALSEDPSGSCRLQFERINPAADAAAEVISEVEFTSGNTAVIRYNTVCAALRGINSVMAGIAGRSSTNFTMQGIMIDLSRNLVLTVPAMTRIFRRLAILGFNTVLLYCEDTYELPGEPAFGMMRGRYTASEIRALDDAAAALGIELIACIQTLGHMAQILQWNSSYGKVKDTVSVMRVDSDRTHELIGKMLDFWSENLRSRRIHVGMDETHDLGRGTYLDEKGYTSGFELFIRQLKLVNAACLKRGLRPMIWSDMFFRLGNPQQIYYTLDSNIPAEVRSEIPPNMQLVYWDYYTNDQNFYEKFIDMHRDLNGDPLMGAGVWIWSRLWCDHKHSTIANRACINGCRDRKLKEIFFTMWGDDGAICHWDSSWTALTKAADLTYGCDDETVSAKRYQVLTGSDYELNKLPGEMHLMTQLSGKEYLIPYMHESDMALFWDDLLLALGCRNLQTIDQALPQQLLDTCRMVMEKLADHRDDCGGGNLNYAWLLARYMHNKLACRMKLETAYHSNDRAALRELADKDIPLLAGEFEEFTVEFRRQWLAVGKVFGLETMQHRMGGQKERIYEAARRITEYLDGVYDSIEELEQPFAEVPERMVLYRDMASGSVLV